jgi:sulfur-carrier protein
VKLSVQYFAWVREAVGQGEETIDMPDTIVTVRHLAEWLAERGSGYEAAFADLQKLRCALDQTIVAFDAPLAGAKEIAFFPPVTGG